MRTVAELETKWYGYVKWFDAKKGYGFIKPENGGEDVFVHYTGIMAEGYKQLQDNDRVSFILEKQGTRYKAVNVVVVDPA